MGGVEMPRAGPGDGIIPTPGSLPPGKEGKMRIFEDNIIWYGLLLHDGGTVQKPVSAEDSSKNK